MPLPAAWLAGGNRHAVRRCCGPAILHLRGHYFAIASLVVAEVLREIINGATDSPAAAWG